MKIVAIDEARALGLVRYFTGQPCCHGHVSERLVSSRGCIKCAYASSRAWAKGSREHLRQYVRERKRRPKDKASKLLLASKGRKKWANDLDVEWIQERIEVGTCALSGIHFDLSPPPEGTIRNPYSPSLDRIDRRRGYTKDNCRLVLTALNIALNEWGEGVYMDIASGVLRVNNNPSEE